MEETRKSAEEFLNLIKKSRLGKLKIYIGMSAGVGKTYRMLGEAHTLLKNGIDVKIGYVETHNRKETEELIAGLPVIPRRKLFYKGKELEELDLQAIINLRPEVVIVDELAHTNIEGSKNQKRWQDVIEIISSGINVITAVNIQHIESLNEQVREITGVEVKERIPDLVLAQADEVVNIDLTADDLISRLKDGKIYQQEKIQTALQNFFTSDNILQLRELALKEVASAVVRKVETEIPKEKKQYRTEKFLCCISSNEKTTKMLIRKTARLANYYNCKWYVLYVQREKENSDKIPLDRQRHLLNNFKLTIELGGEVIKREGNSVAKIIYEESEKLGVTTICIGKPTFRPIPLIFGKNFFSELLTYTSKTNIDLLILS
ncbi:MAG TPA: sensor protein KdpD [Petrimonas sp.]|nr:sensor protein KdpD [Petrimonas sp.]